MSWRGGRRSLFLRLCLSKYHDPETLDDGSVPGRSRVTLTRILQRSQTPNPPQDTFHPPESLEIVGVVVVVVPDRTSSVFSTPILLTHSFLIFFPGSIFGFPIGSYFSGWFVVQPNTSSEVCLVEVSDTFVVDGGRTCGSWWPSPSPPPFVSPALQVHNLTFSDFVSTVPPLLLSFTHSFSYLWHSFSSPHYYDRSFHLCLNPFSLETRHPKGSADVSIYWGSERTKCSGRVRLGRRRTFRDALFDTTLILEN